MAVSSIDERLTEFIKFPNLPTEVRDKIWGYALEGLRIVEFSATPKAFWKNPPPQSPPTAPGEDRSIKILQRPHSLFHVCHDSRELALKKKSLQLGTESPGLANTRIDPHEDLVCFPYIKGATFPTRDERLFHESIWSEGALKLERIAIDSRAWHTWSMGEILNTFKHLKELTIIMHSHSCQTIHEDLEKHGWALNKRSSAGIAETAASFQVLIHMILGQYQRQFDDWWQTDGGKPGDQWVKPQLVGSLLECDERSCCEHQSLDDFGQYSLLGVLFDEWQQAIGQATT